MPSSLFFFRTPKPNEKSLATTPAKLARRDMSKQEETAKIKAKVIRLITEGCTVEDAMRQVGRSAKLWDYYRSTDKEFKETVDKVRAARSKHGRIQSEESLEMDFRTFRKEYLEADTFPHQMNIINLLEGNDPEWMHDSMQYEKGRPQYVLVNVPPEHAKSMTTSIDYPVYRICMDPNIRIMIVSKSQQKATEFIYAIKQRLTHPSWQKLQLCLLYTSPSPRDKRQSRMPSSA